jgi:cyclopropane fatty-acyl-phospholipid synthase-like methyltransferase
VGGIGHAVKTGETTFTALHGEPFFSYLKNHPDDQGRFDAGMATNSRSSDEAIARAYDFSRASVVLDVGGGRGGLVRAIVESHPGVKGILFDQPQVAERATLPWTTRYARIGGNFFEKVPEGADVYVIKGVLHDFDDEKALQILKNCRRVMSPQSRLLIVERLISPDNAPHQAKTIDLLMMALLGGRERSIPEWEGLLRAANLALVQQHPTASEFTISECAPVN